MEGLLGIVSANETEPSAVEVVESAGGTHTMEGEEHVFRLRFEGEITSDGRNQLKEAA